MGHEINRDMLLRSLAGDCRVVFEIFGKKRAIEALVISDRKDAYRVF